MRWPVALHDTGYVDCQSAWERKRKTFVSRSSRIGDSPYEIMFFTRGSRKIAALWQNYDGEVWMGTPMNFTRIKISIMGVGSMEFDHPTSIPQPGCRLYNGRFPRLPSETVSIWYRPEWHISHTCTARCEFNEVLW